MDFNTLFQYCSMDVQQYKRLGCLKIMYHMTPTRRTTPLDHHALTLTFLGLYSRNRVTACACCLPPMPSVLPCLQTANRLAINNTSVPAHLDCFAFFTTTTEIIAAAASIQREHIFNFNFRATKFEFPLPGLALLPSPCLAPRYSRLLRLRWVSSVTKVSTFLC